MKTTFSLDRNSIIVSRIEWNFSINWLLKILYWNVKLYLTFKSSATKLEKLLSCREWREKFSLIFNFLLPAWAWINPQIKNGHVCCVHTDSLHHASVIFLFVRLKYLNWLFIALRRQREEIFERNEPKV